MTPSSRSSISAVPLHRRDDPRMAGFMDNLDRVNALAERSAGFVWRLKDESNNATALRPFDDPDMAVNLSVWESVEALERFVWATVHKRIYNRKARLVRAGDRAAFRDVADRGGHMSRPRRGEGAARPSDAARRQRLRVRLESSAAHQALDEPEMRMIAESGRRMKIESAKHRLDVHQRATFRGRGSTTSTCRARDFHDVNMSGCSFDDLNMSGWRVHNVNLAGLKIEKANLAGASIVDAQARRRDDRRDCRHGPARLLAGRPRGGTAHEQDHHRRQGARRSGRIHAAPGLRGGRRRSAALLLPRAAVDRRQLPHVPRRGEGRPAEADRVLRDGGAGTCGPARTASRRSSRPIRRWRARRARA